MTDYPPISPFVAGLRGKCPRCGQGALFAGYLALRPSCPFCGLDYQKADPGDGPAVFVIFIVGFVAVALAFIARFVWYASALLAYLISAGAALVLIFTLLRPFKATLIAFQFAHKAAQGKPED
jgi:uncharacterized protein (DUF983 family)